MFEEVVSVIHKYLRILHRCIILFEKRIVPLNFVTFVSL